MEALLAIIITTGSILFGLSAFGLYWGFKETDDGFVKLFMKYLTLTMIYIGGSVSLIVYVL